MQISFINICILSLINMTLLFNKVYVDLQTIYKKKSVKAVKQLILLTSCSWLCVKEGNLDNKDNNSVCRPHLMESSDTLDNNLMYRSTPWRWKKKVLAKTEVPLSILNTVQK